ncbi:terminase small subunit [Acidobacteriia bacterium AH_259_A11_L15]|nr:terminase small subunit [Acidobacteriia bacterium AH_259_A11_L15]
MRKASDHGKKPDGRKISRKLKLKQRRFVVEFTNPEGEAFGNLTKAAELAGYEPRSAYNQGHRLMKNDEIKREIERVLDKHAVTLDVASEVLAEGMRAEFVRVFCLKSGKLRFAPPQPDHQERRLSADMVFKLRGAYPTPQAQERIALLQIQQNFLLVPPVERKAKKAVEVLAREVDE